ncbi:unnamed protein product [Polarella glacialis]|uniref:SAM-dependent MTase RsmB/NOP-type domain-containing protein n=1 Tax=Polarella glacialis TaxID=89957 RepID=A0A813FWA7_POLGL|nr:unnamed protein product [Polarella glacialis]
MTCEAPAGIDGKDGPSYVDSVTAASSSGRRRHGDRRGEGRKKTRAFVPVPETSAGSVAFEAYYKAQGIVPDAEWSDFMGFMRKPLPVVVRVNARRAGWEELKAAFAADPRFQQLAWYPGGLAFQCASASLDGPLRECLGQLNRSYALRMQEAASLLPALLMRPGPEDLVLDMAAAPGGKSLQILELMAAAGDGGHGLGGAIIANDGDAERAMELLPLMLRKAHHPGIAVTLGSAAKFPAVFAPPGANEASTSQSADRQVLLDRVLCDVPCSSDGTLRKAPGIMARWRPHQGSLLHKKQLTILRRGLHLLKKGGRLVYSTCSLNPIECEAVVAAALAAFRGDCELVEDEAVEELRRAGLRARAGLASWKVPDTQRPKRQKAPDDQPPASEVGSAGVGCTLYTSLEEVQVPKEALSGLCATMFPPSNPEVLSQLRKAVRLLPQDNDSSGFFVAVFTKTRHWDAQPLSNSTPLPVEAVAVPALAPEKATVQADQMPLGAVATLRWRARNDLNVYELLDAAIDPEAQSIASYYGIDLSDPTTMFKHIIT